MINTFAHSLPFGTSPFGCAFPTTQSFGTPVNGFGAPAFSFPGYGGINGHFGHTFAGSFPGYSVEVPFGVSPFVGSSVTSSTPWQYFGQVGNRPPLSAFGGFGSAFAPTTPFGTFASAGLPISGVPFNSASYGPLAGLTSPTIGTTPWTSPFLGTSIGSPWTTPFNWAGATPVPQSWHGWASPVAGTQTVPGTTGVSNGTSTFVGPFGVQREAA